MMVYAITDTKKGRTGIAPTYLQTTRGNFVAPTTIFLINSSLKLSGDFSSLKLRRRFKKEKFIINTKVCNYLTRNSVLI